ncbi:MAG: hypothetical protein GH155_05445 [Spirochaeta sp.]|nr:hypothetical protein [Spirochaeta sp.]
MALFSLSLFAFIFALTSFELREIEKSSSVSAHIKITAIFLFIMAAGILLLWLSDIIPALLNRETPDILKGGGYTLFIQALDLGVVVPVSIITGVLLFQKSPWGLLLAPVVLVKGFTLAGARNRSY